MILGPEKIELLRKLRLFRLFTSYIYDRIFGT